MTLQLDGLSVTFDQNRAVDGVSLTVAQGSVLALLGPSGCGKSTLLRAVAGLVTPTSGTITWAGTDLGSVPTERRDIGFMFQHHALFLHRNVADNVAFGLRMRGESRAAQRERVEELLALVGLEGFARRSVEHLSGGEAQRVALARALAPQPRLLLLDEPLASLDRARRDELNAELARLLDELEQTAIYVTHDQDEAFAIADQLAVMHAGRIVRQGTPAEVWRDPQTELVARFLGHETIVDVDGVRLAVLTEAVRLVDPHGAARVGEVARCRFGGDRYGVEVRVDGDVWHAWSLDPIPLGTRVGLDLDPTRCAPIE